GSSLDSSEVRCADAVARPSASSAERLTAGPSASEYHRAIDSDVPLDREIDGSANSAATSLPQRCPRTVELSPHLSVTGVEPTSASTKARNAFVLISIAIRSGQHARHHQTGGPRSKTSC